MTNTLFDLSLQSLRVALLRLRTIDGADSEKDLLTRLIVCRGIDLAHLRAALPESGLKAPLLRLLEKNLPELHDALDAHWRHLCLLEFGRNQMHAEGIKRPWRMIYEEQHNLDAKKVHKAAGNLKLKYHEEDRKVHQLKTIAAVSVAKPRAKTASAKPSTAGSLMERSRREALQQIQNRTAATGTSTKAPFRMRQPFNAKK